MEKYIYKHSKKKWVNTNTVFVEFFFITCVLKLELNFYPLSLFITHLT